MKHLRIVFMGTPEFAVASLEALIASSHQVVAVVTVADKPAGRGQKLQESPVKQCAVKHGIPVLQPEKLKSPEFIEQLSSFQADLFVVVAFRMLPEVVWNMPPMGTINLHGSLLPRYRGAAPINWAVINGEKETGVTTFFLQHEIDTGNVIMQKAFPIGGNDTAGDVHDKMMHFGADVLRETVDKIGASDIKPLPQDDLISQGAALKHAPKIFKEDCKIVWNTSLEEIHNFIRGLAPYPAAWTILQGKSLKIFSGKKIYAPDTKAGEFFTDQKNVLRFAASDGWYEITDLQFEGKKRMKTDEFLRGWRP